MPLIEQYGHGGDLLTAQKVFGFRGEKFLDFSANINPLGPPSSVMERLKSHLDTIVHYPDPAQRKLKQKLSERLAVPIQHLLIGNGAAECMALVILAIKPEKVGVIYPCFSEYEQLANSFGATIKACYGKEELQLKPDLSELFDLIAEVNLVFIGHPNNPTGTVYTLEELKQIAEHAERTKTYIVFDEAFIDFLSHGKQLTLLPELDRFNHVIIIRSMTKFYAIPGLRLGYTVAHPALISGFIEKQVTWSVNQLALVAGELCLDEQDYAEETISLIQKQRQYVKSKIENDLGWFVFPGQANYLLVRPPKTIKASDLQWRMGKKGILIRSCSMYEGLTPYDFRIAIRNQRENELFLKTLKETVKEGCEQECP
jgi:threonine-phosphate decarboxylase